MVVWGSHCLQDCLQELMYSLHILSPGCATHFVKLIKISDHTCFFIKVATTGCGMTTKVWEQVWALWMPAKISKRKQQAGFSNFWQLQLYQVTLFIFFFIISSVTLIKLFLRLTAWRDQDIRGNKRGKTTLSRPLPCFSAVSQTNVCNLWSFK